VAAVEEPAGALGDLFAGDAGGGQDPGDRLEVLERATSVEGEGVDAVEQAQWRGAQHEGAAACRG
jgi:hypothetical protein